MLELPWNSLFVLYACSTFLYLLHCSLVWTHWSWAKEQSQKPLWVRANLSWVFAGWGHFPLTNGRIAAHLILALIPGINTFLFGMQAGYILVGAAEHLWLARVRAWWNRPVHGH